MVRYVQRSEWGADPSGNPGANGPIHAQTGGVCIHYVGSRASQGVDNHNDCNNIVRGIQAGHLQGEYQDIAYNFLVCTHGYMFIGRGFEYQSGANGTNAANDAYYAVCGLLGVPDTPSATMLDGIRQIIRDLRSVNLAGYGVIGHQNVTGVDTACPGSLYPYVQDGTLNPPDTLPPTDPLPVVPPEPPPGGGAPTWPGVLFTNPPPTEHDGVVLWQARMLERGWNITVDGIYGDQSQNVCEQFQAEKGLVVDGIVGRETWIAAWEAPIS